jgi:methyltransferase (TIGR00027 family)
MREDMRDRSRASFTADAACAARAHGSMHRDERLRNPDCLALALVGMPFRVLLWPVLRSRFVAEFERRAPGMYFYHQARTKHFDAIVLGEIERGISQLVVLGAGFDSRGYRFADRLRGVRVFEVDHPATSSEKQRRVRARLGADASRQVAYVAVDFSRDDLGARLAAASFTREAPTYFHWEGVAMYLPAAAVDAMLAFVARTGRGSSIALDYLFRGAIEGSDPDAIQHRELAARHGEPFQFGVDPDDVATLFRRNGLSLATNVGADELSARYLVGSDGRRWGKAFSLVGVAHGRAL